MNLKIALAAVLLISGGSYVSHAQQSNTSQATVSTSKSFEKKIAAYQKEADAAKSATLLSEMTKEMTNGMAAAKSEYASANSETSGPLMKKFETRAGALNEVMRTSRADSSNKTAIVTALKKYAQTL